MVRFSFTETCWLNADPPGMPMMDAYTMSAASTGLMSVSFGFDGEKLQMVAIRVESRVLDSWSEIAEETAGVEYDFFKDIADTINSELEADCGKVTMADIDQKYIIVNNQKIFRTSVVQGAFIGCLITFVVILAPPRISSSPL